MKTGAFDIQWFARRLGDEHVSLSKPFRDFIMERLCRHRLGESGVFDAIAEVLHWYNSKRLIEHNRLVAELELPLEYYRSYWEIPPELIDNRQYMFLSLATCISQETEFGIIGMTSDEYEAYRETLAKRKGDT